MAWLGEELADQSGATRAPRRHKGNCLYGAFRCQVGFIVNVLKFAAAQSRP
jgi:hypothetical protein